MISETIAKDIQEQLTRLPLENQLQVLEFASKLVKTKAHGVPGQNLLHFAGTIDHEDLMEIERAIKNGCEKIISHEW